MKGEIIMKLSIADYVKIGLSDMKTKHDFDKVIAKSNRESRKAESNSDNKGNPLKNRFGKKSKKTEESKVEETKTENSANAEYEVKEAKTEESKTEEQVNAEKEAPVEEAGAEKINVETEASPIGEAAMKDPTADDPHKKVDIVFDFNKMSGSVVPDPIPQAPPQVQPQQQYGHPMSSPFVQQMANNFAAQMHPGQGRHKVDVQEPPKPPVQKAEPDNVQVDLSNMTPLEVNPPKPPKEWPEVVAQPVPQAEHVKTELEPKFDNSQITSSLRYMADIEKVALNLGYQVQMVQRTGPDGNPDGMIAVYTYMDGSPNPIMQKAFTIDTGVIIDRRAKMFPVTLNYGYEKFQAYPVLVPVPDSKGKKKNMFNQKLFEDFFRGGIQMLDEKDGMFTPDYRELNENVSLITMPTAHMNGEIRRTIRDRLLAAMKAGVFEQAKRIEPNSRFRFENYDKKTGEYILTNVGVPVAYDGPVVSKIPVKIRFTKDTAILDYPNML